MTAAVVPTWALAAVSCLACVWAACVDARERRLPNPLVACVALCALAQMALVAAGLALPAGLPSAPERLAWAAFVLACLIGTGLVWRLLRGESGMGMGDVKLLGALALWLGADVVWVLAGACLTACVVNLALRRTRFAFGPYLAAFGCALLVLACRTA